MAHTLDTTRLGEIFDQLLAEDRLSKWERGFVESVNEQWLAKGKLSDAQLETLEDVYLRY